MLEAIASIIGALAWPAVVLWGVYLARREMRRP